MQFPANTLEPRTPLDGGPADAPHASGHGVQFFEDEVYLVTVVVDFLAAGLTHGHPALVIATRPHCAAFLRGLRSRGLDVGRIRREGRLSLLDARETLDTFLVEGSPDAERFGASVGSVLRGLAQSHPGAGICAYGEMVDLLWRDGNPEGAIRLEELWNELARSHSFSLLCGYAMQNFASASHAAHFEEICRQHRHVFPTERYSAADEAARSVEISTLQQRARALETEIARRAELEAQLREALAEKEAVLERERAARAEAERANRAKNDFLAVMSHELRTPLNAIAGYAELLELGVHGPVAEPQRTALERIQRSQRHLLGLIDEVLIYARSEAGTVRYSIGPVPMDEVLRSAGLLVMPQMRAKGLDYEYAGCPDELAAWADRDKLHQILLNLLTNAMKFTEPGGHVRLEGVAKGCAVRVRVSDTGIGIPADKLESVFQPFMQVDTRLSRVNEGIGLGLAISRDFARGMGGDLTVSSSPGQGSTFTLTLPRHAP